MNLVQAMQPSCHTANATAAADLTSDRSSGELSLALPVAMVAKRAALPVARSRLSRGSRRYLQHHRRDLAINTFRTIISNCLIRTMNNVFALQLEAVNYIHTLPKLISEAWQLRIARELIYT